MAKPTPARTGAPGVETWGAAYDERTDVQEQRWKREARLIGIIVVVVALLCGALMVCGDTLGVGPYP